MLRGKGKEGVEVKALCIRKINKWNNNAKRIGRC
jgi:hypothetical protein